jgi:phosphatidylserine decarboxylase
MKLLGFIPIAKEGLVFILISLFFLAVQILLFSFNLYSIALLAISIFITAFFRTPDRKTPEGEDLVISPADGKVIFVGETDENRILKRKVKKISIFMSVFNVHVNRMPISGKIKKIIYNPGKFFNAASPKSSLENEQNAIVVERKDNTEIMFVQIAGLVARRIVSYLKVGNAYNSGEIMGLIRFGSRLDIYLPLESEICVKLKEKTKAGQSVLAKLQITK